MSARRATVGPGFAPFRTGKGEIRPIPVFYTKVPTLAYTQFTLRIELDSCVYVDYNCA